MIKSQFFSGPVSLGFHLYRCFTVLVQPQIKEGLSGLESGNFFPILDKWLKKYFALLSVSLLWRMLWLYMKNGYFTSHFARNKDVFYWPITCENLVDFKKVKSTKL